MNKAPLLGRRPEKPGGAGGFISQYKIIPADNGPCATARPRSPLLRELMLGDKSLWPAAL